MTPLPHPKHDLTKPIEEMTPLERHLYREEVKLWRRARNRQLGFDPHEVEEA